MFQFNYNAVSVHNVKIAIIQESTPGCWEIKIYYFNDDKPAILKLGRVSKNTARQVLEEFVVFADHYAGIAN